MRKVRNLKNKGFSLEMHLLYDERKIVKDRIARVDSMMFNFIAVVVSPFCVLVGYALLNLNSNVKYVLLVIPYFSVLAVMVVALIYMHHYVTSYYSRYLVDKINDALTKSRLLLEDMDYAFFAKGFGVQNVFIFVCLFLVALVNILVSSIITDLLYTLPTTDMISGEQINIFSLGYWLCFAMIYLICLLACYNQFVRKVRTLRNIIQHAVDKEALPHECLGIE
jgi:hypothetical protein